MAQLCFYEKGTHDNPYVLAVRLTTDQYADVSSFKGVKDRTFSIYRWSVVTLNGEPYCGYMPFIFYSPARKWQKYPSLSKIQAKQVDNALLPAHQFFKTLEEFKEWLGEKEFQTLVAYLL